MSSIYAYSHDWFHGHVATVSFVAVPVKHLLGPS